MDTITISSPELHEAYKGSMDRCISETLPHEYKVTHVVKIIQMTNESRIRLGEHMAIDSDGVRNFKLLSDPTEVSKIELLYSGRVVDTIYPSITGDTEFAFFKGGQIFQGSVFCNTELRIVASSLIVYSFEFLHLDIEEQLKSKQVSIISLITNCTQLLCEKHVIPSGITTMESLHFHHIVTRLRMFSSGPITGFSLKTHRGDLIEFPIQTETTMIDATFDPTLNLKGESEIQIIAKEPCSIWIMCEHRNVWRRCSLGLADFAFSK